MSNTIRNTINSLVLFGLASLSMAQSPVISGCNVMPTNSVWNTPVDKLPVDPNSAAYVASLNATKSTLYPVFNSTGWGMPFNTEAADVAKVPVTFTYASQSDAGPYPVNSSTVIENGSDHHALIVDTANCVLYELFGLTSTSSGWHAGSGAIYSLNSNTLRPAGWTSADAAGLPIFPGMVRVDEVLAGHINHALRLTADHTRNSYIWPARHAASKLTGGTYPPMGQRFRLKASFNISGYAPQAQVILQALKTYGLILADNGPSWDLTGAGDSRWDDAALNSMKNISGNNFEAVDESSLMIDANSAQARQSSSTLPTGWVQVIASSSNKCLDMVGGLGGTQATDKTQQWTCGGSSQTDAQFMFVPVSGGYKIQNRNSGLFLEITGGTSAANGAAIEQWSYDGQSYQTWSVAANTDGTYAIRPNSNLGECMQQSGPYYENGAPVVQYTCNVGASERWKLVPVN